MDLSGVSEPCQSGSCVLHTAVIVVTSTLIICANLINIIIIPRSLNISRTYGKYFMLSLACADLGVGLIVTPFSILPSVHGYWMYGAQWCTFLAITVAALCSISIFSIMCVCIDRYIHIQHALRYDENPFEAKVSNHSSCNLDRNIRNIYFAQGFLWKLLLWSQVIHLYN